MSLLELEDLTVKYQELVACKDVSLEVGIGQCVGLIGQSGSGKSSVVKSILDLNGEGAIQYKKLSFSGLDFSKLGSKQRQQIRQNIAWIPQDPSTALCEHLTMQTQLTEQMRFVQKQSKKQALKKAIEMMELVGISHPKLRLKQYPHQLSGGIKQRMLIAMALCQNPKLIIADELTASLDTFNKANLAKLILQIKRELQIAFLIISHDINFIHATCSKVYAMFASQIVESQNAQDFFENPKHPYCRDLIEATPTITKPGKKICIETNHQSGCRYAKTCNIKQKQCSEQSPHLYQLGQAQVRCFLYDPTETKHDTINFKKN